jgi:hypothetical protein
MAQAVCRRRPLTTVAWVNAQVNPVGFVVDQVALGQAFSRVLWFSPVNIIPSWATVLRKLKKQFIHLFIHLFTHPHPRTDKSRKSGRSSVRRQSHPHNQNTRKK